MKRNPNRPHRREPYHYDATGAQYIACIETALQHGPSIPLHVLQMIYHMLLPYMHSRPTDRNPAVLILNVSSKGTERIYHEGNLQRQSDYRNPR